MTASSFLDASKHLHAGLCSTDSFLTPEKRPAGGLSSPAPKDLATASCSTSAASGEAQSGTSAASGEPPSGCSTTAATSPLALSEGAPPQEPKRMEQDLDVDADGTRPPEFEWPADRDPNAKTHAAAYARFDRRTKTEMPAALKEKLKRPGGKLELFQDWFRSIGDGPNSASPAEADPATYSGTRSLGI